MFHPVRQNWSLVLWDTRKRSEERRVGKSVRNSVDLGGRRIIKKKKDLNQLPDHAAHVKDILLRRDVAVGAAVVFFFKQKTAYEIVPCDWSSDVCSSDLHAHPRPRVQGSGREQGRLDHHARHRRPQVPGRVPVRHSDRTRRRRRDERHCELPHRSGAAAREHRLARRRRGARSQAPARQAVTIADGVKAAALLFVAAIAQVSIFSQLHVFGGVPQLVLVTLVSVALLRGAVVGALAGFFAGLVVDTATLGQLGLTSLVLTVSGYWIGRYGETTGRDRGHAPFLSVAVVTFLYEYGVLLVEFMLGERAPAGAVMRS